MTRRSGEDITRSVLTQIIVEEEGKGGQNMLPIGFLRQLISLYGDNLQFMVPRYLESSMEAFARNQDQMRSYFKERQRRVPVRRPFEEMSKQNMALFERAMQMFTPFAAGQAGKPPGASPAGAAAGPAAPAEQGSIDTLRQKLDDLQRQIEEITKPKQ